MTGCEHFIPGLGGDADPMSALELFGREVIPACQVAAPFASRPGRQGPRRRDGVRGVHTTTGTSPMTASSAQSHVRDPASQVRPGRLAHAAGGDLTVACVTLPVDGEANEWVGVEVEVPRWVLSGTPDRLGDDISDLVDVAAEYPVTLRRRRIDDAAPCPGHVESRASPVVSMW